MDHVASRDADGFARKAGIGQIARVTAQEVIGDATADAVEFDALPDQPCAGQGPVHVERQHLGGQNLQLKRNGQTVLGPARSDADEDLARQEDLARSAPLQPVEIRQAFGVCIIGPGEPQRLQLFLLGRIRDGRGGFDAIAHHIAGEGFHGVRRIAIVPDQPARPGGDRVARGRDQRVHMGAAGTEPAQATVRLCGIEATDD